MVAKIPETICNMVFNSTFCATSSGNIAGLAPLAITLIAGVAAARFLLTKPSVSQPLQSRQVISETDHIKNDQFAWVQTKTKEELEKTDYEGMPIFEYALCKPEPKIFITLVKKGFRCEFNEELFAKMKKRTY